MNNEQETNPNEPSPHDNAAEQLTGHSYGIAQWETIPTNHLTFQEQLAYVSSQLLQSATPQSDTHAHVELQRPQGLPVNPEALFGCSTGYHQPKTDGMQILPPPNLKHNQEGKS